jgi:hypothetical protein
MATDDTMTIGERVVSACHSTNLRDETDRVSQTDVLKAMAWSQSRLGSALMRLHSEYDSVAKPRPVTHENMIQMALKHKSADKNKGTEKGLTQKQCEIMAKNEADTWLTNEKALFLGKLKTLSAVVEQLTTQCQLWGIPEPKRVATVSVGHWLDQVCPSCHGHKFELMPDSPTLSTKQCKECKGIGLSETPYGQAGKKVLNHLDNCVSRAQSSIKARLSRLQGV